MAWAIYLAKARNNLRTAQHAYEQGDFDSCVSRATLPCCMWRLRPL